MRWRPPGRGALLRLTVVAVLLATAAGLVWLRPMTSPCSAAPDVSAAPAAPAAAKSGSPTPDGKQTIPANEPTVPAGPDGKPAAPERRPAIPEGTVGVPVRLADPTGLALVRPGNVVDLLRLDDGGDSIPIASAALVLDVTGADDPASGGLLLALAPEQAGRAVAGQGHGFAILIRPG
ncbi:hypothetical protein [Actinoplanes siamensis]|uniref:hypothetical protein n=1 Tax=Actinoplanes siamensis TaxID=1223317 RepID=UPI001EF1B2B6|nr:hypothetical protein [Actinoplanes siamensis]